MPSPCLVSGPEPVLHVVPGSRASLDDLAPGSCGISIPDAFSTRGLTWGASPLGTFGNCLAGSGCHNCGRRGGGSVKRPEMLLNILRVTGHAAVRIPVAPNQE